MFPVQTFSTVSKIHISLHLHVTGPGVLQELAVTLRHESIQALHEGYPHRRSPVFEKRETLLDLLPEVIKGATYFEVRIVIGRR
jgi:hypothetical protein